MSADPLILILVFLSVTGAVLSLTSLSGRRVGRVRVRILRRAGEGPLAPIAASDGHRTRGQVGLLADPVADLVADPCYNRKSL